MWWIAVIILAILLAGSLFAYFYTFFALSKKEDYHSLPKGDDYSKGQEKMHQMIEEMAKVDCTCRLNIKSYDGTRLSARYYHAADGAPLHIEFHGYKGSGIRDFCGINRLARELGHNTLIVDQRAAGQSGKRTITFGVKEHRDVKAWAEHCAKLFGADTPIFLSGVSMGATTVLLASRLNINANIVGIMADCPYDTPKRIIQKVTRDMRLPARLIYPFVRLGAVLFGHFDPNTVDAAESVRHTRIPLLIMHGEADRFVPVEMSHRIAAHAVGYCERHTFPDAGHGLSFIKDEPRYIALATAFINNCLQGKL